MNIADNLGMPEPIIQEESAEDRMLLPIGLLYNEGGHWHTVYLTRDDVKHYLGNIRPGITREEYFEARPLVAIRFSEVEGPECNMQFIYDYVAGTWRLE